MRWYNNLYEKKISAIGLSVFRIAFFVNFFFEVLFIFRYRQLFFDKVPFIEQFELDFTIPLIIWLFVIIGIIIGLYTRFLLILNYFFVLVFIGSLSWFEYHMDFIYTGVCFVLMFIPLSYHLSIDRVIGNTERKKVSQLYYFLVVFTGIGLVYFDSVLYKLTSQLWLNGLGVWLPASVPQMTVLNDQWLLNQKTLMLFLGYLTLVFEALFIFIFWVKRFRIYLSIIGIGLHVGILFEFPIPQFAIGMLTLYLLMIPNLVWDKLLGSLRFETSLNSFILKIFGVFPKIKTTGYSDKKVLQILFAILIILQLNTSLTAPAVEPLRNKLYLDLDKIYLKDKFHEIHTILFNFSKKALGITKHGVFIDSHFKNYNHIVAITYNDSKQEIWLPFIDENGMASSSCTGSVWAYLGFRTNNANVKPDQFENGVKRFTAFWAKKNNIDLNKAQFIIKVKKIDLPNWVWEKDYLTKQIDKPWQNAGTGLWDDREFRLALIKPIEEF